MNVLSVLNPVKWSYYQYARENNQNARTKNPKADDVVTYLKVREREKITEKRLAEHAR